MKQYSGFKLLIVDDHERNLFTLRTLVQQHMDVEILEATSGRQALDIALGQPDTDLIILDIQMPEMDGFEITRQIRNPDSQVRNPNIPIIALTAKTEDLDMEACLEAGADDFVIKPVGPKDLKEIIARHLPDPT